MMSYLELLHSKDYSKSQSKEESIKILAKYKDELTQKEYQSILNSLCSHAMEGMFFNEENILLSISQLKNEITMSEIVELVKAY